MSPFNKRSREQDALLVNKHQVTHHTPGEQSNLTATGAPALAEAASVCVCVCVKGTKSCLGAAHRLVWSRSHDFNLSQVL